MAWFRIALSVEQLRIVSEERLNHPHVRVRERMLALSLLHSGLTREKAAKTLGISRATVERIVAAFRDGGLDGVRQWNVVGRTSELAAFRDLIRESFEELPARTVAEAAARIERLTGLRRSPTQVRQFMKELGLKWQRVRAVPVPPKKVSGSMWRSRPASCGRS